LTHHISKYVQDGDDALIFTSPAGTPLRHSNFTRRVWLPATRDASLTGVRFHDLRHAGNLFTAHAGANLRELMARMGHSTTRAAAIYLHSTDERQRTLVDVVDQAVRADLRQAKKMPASSKKPPKAKDVSGTEVARNRKHVS
jgi:integrase